MATMSRLSILCLLVALSAGLSPAEAHRRLRADDDRSESRLIPPCAAGFRRGPSSSQDAYMLPYPNTTEASFVAILSVGDSAANGYTMVGIPDGLGAYDDDDDDSTHFFVLMNQENQADVGAVRDHGAPGAFVSKWTINKHSLAVLAGEDLIKKVWAWDRASKSYRDPNHSPAVAMSRFCSATLPKQSALYNPKSRKGTRDMIFINGEEDGLDGRAFAHVVTGPYAGNSFELPHFSNAGFENLNPNSNLHKLESDGAADKTVVVATDDNGHNRVFVYVGEKSGSGTPVEKAGLVSGKLYVIYLENLYDEITNGGGLVQGDTVPFTATLLSEDLSGADGTGMRLRQRFLPVDNTHPTPATKNTKFDRPEDGHWHPEDPHVFYFATTANFNGIGRHSRLWMLKFEDPTLTKSVKGVATVLINGPDGADTSGPKMMDNIGINGDGEMIIQEDIGNQVFLGRLWQYNLKSKKLQMIGQHNAAMFGPPTPSKTTDEESSGVISVEGILGDGWWLLDVQAHKMLPNNLVEDGQLLAMYTGKCKRRDD